MKGSQDAALKLRLKELIVRETDKPVDAAGVPDDQPLFGPKSALELDSVDGLQISMALQLEFGLRVEDPKQMRRILADLNTLADFVQPQ
ncbi:acyl carrier protein [Solimonas soli]|uniref:acyl carrier protein n=1 Tax=Solimonas soli TaxID=413479 RepID=UPI000485FB64|nr:acyl carrier protein [Solimonas soli]